MKAIILTLSLFVLGANIGRASSYPTKQITQYQHVHQQTIELPTNFAKQFIVDQKDIDLLAGKTIHHVELVYTKYAESPNFNQKALNSQRIAQLKKLLPQANSDQPSWTWLEQTGATTRDAANDYFHGFVIHYGDKLDHNALGEFFSGVSNKAKRFKVNLADGGTFKHSSGTSIHVPKNAVTYKNGKALSGHFTLLYTEYRNPAEIALSGLPMLYKGDNFSSIGMYELRGEKDGEELKLVKPIIVDFNCTKIVDDAAFFSMDDKTGEWKKHQDLDFSSTNTREVKKVEEATRAEVGNTAPTSKLPVTTYLNWSNIDKKTAKATLDSTAWKYYNEMDATKQSLGVVSTNSSEKSLIIKTGKKAEFQRRVMNQVYSKGQYDEFWGGYTIVAGGNSQMSASASGHIYPSLVTGLRSSNFGVYNCDQVYRMGKTARLSPIYEDVSSNKTIDNAYVACVIDLTKNGSFSFHPNNLTVSKTGRNAILLFTAEKEIYLIDENAFSQLNLQTSQTISIPMKNVTSDLTSPSDLKRMLNI